jgi:hypothetical protein
VKKIYNRYISILLVYYWAWFTFSPIGGGYEVGSVVYYLHIIPVLALSVLGIYDLVSLSFRSNFKYLLLFLVTGAVSSLVNVDVRSLLALIIFVIPIYIIYKYKISFSVKYVNYMYIITVVFTISAYHLGFNDWGYIPGHAIGKRQDVWWRINIFPFRNIPYSALFSTAVLVANLYGNKRSKLLSNLCLILAGYFILFSGNRTSYIIVISIITISLLFKYRYNFINKYFPVITISLVLFLMLVPSYLVMYDTPKLVNYILYRSSTKPSLSELLLNPRLILYHNLIHIYSLSPIFGHGSFNLYSYFPSAPSHSECKWLSLLAEYGLSSLFLFIFFLKTYIGSIKLKHYNKMFFTLMIIIGFMFYGSMFNTYNFIFILLLLMSNNRFAQKHR